MLRPFLAIGLILTMLVAACAAPMPTPTRGPIATPTPTLTPAYDHAYTQGYKSATREGLGTHGQRHAYAKAYAEARESGLNAAAAAVAARSSAAAVPDPRIYPTPTPFPTLSPEQRRTGPTYPSTGNPETATTMLDRILAWTNSGAPFFNRLSKNASQGIPPSVSECRTLLRLMREGDAIDIALYDSYIDVTTYPYDLFIEALGALRILYNVTAANGFC